MRLLLDWGQWDASASLTKNPHSVLEIHTLLPLDRCML